MAHDPRLLDRLEDLETRSWSGLVFRYTAGERPPDRENTHGARWNRRDNPTIYTSVDRETAVEEFRHHVGVLSPAPTRLIFTLYTLRVSVRKIVDLSSYELLAELGLTEEHLAGDDMLPCQKIGAAVVFLERGGLLVPSARKRNRTNLVIFPHQQSEGFEFEIEHKEPLRL